MFTRPLLFLLLLSALAACGSSDGRVLVLDEAYPTAAPLVNYLEPEGYDGHLKTRWFDRSIALPSKPARGCDVPERYGVRKLGGLATEIATQIEESGYDINLLRERVDQVVLHYDVCGCSRQCFKVLHDIRGLSCHFLLDLDGTVYQTLDLVHRGRHATIANDRSIGIEIAHPGAYGDREDLRQWYRTPDGMDRIVFDLKSFIKSGTVQTPEFVAYPSRPGVFDATINGRRVHQHDFTEEQYRSLIHLLRTLREVFPKVEARVPYGSDGRILLDKLPDEEFQNFRGILGHFHVQTNKIDPGPAMDWDRIHSGLISQ